MATSDTPYVKTLMELDEEPKQRPLPEIEIMLRIIRYVSWVNLLVGLPSVILVLSMQSMTLFFTGLLSLATFCLMQMMVRHMSATKSWTEFGVTAMCGIYFPSFVLWLCSTSLMEAILG